MFRESKSEATKTAGMTRSNYTAGATRVCKEKVTARPIFAMALRNCISFLKISWLQEIKFGQDGCDGVWERFIIILATTTARHMHK